MYHTLLVLTLLGAGPEGTNDPTATHAKMATKATVRCPKREIFPAVDIVRAYRDNQAYAAEYFESKDAKGNGKIIQVSGRMIELKNITKEGDEKETFAALVTPDGKPPKTISLSFHFQDEDRCKLAQLSASQYITVRGAFLAKKVVNPATGAIEIQFNKCKLVD